MNQKIFSDYRQFYQIFNIIVFLWSHSRLSTYGTPTDKGTIMSQFRVWPFPFIVIVIFGERNRNPDHRFVGVYYRRSLSLKIISIQVFFYLHPYHSNKHLSLTLQDWEASAGYLHENN
jgi:hypothetical protein